MSSGEEQSEEQREESVVELNGSEAELEPQKESGSVGFTLARIDLIDVADPVFRLHIMSDLEVVLREGGRIGTGITQALAATMTLPGQGGDWRLPIEAADIARDRLVDRCLRGDPPDRPLEWLGAVYRNLLCSGPARIEQRRSRSVTVEFMDLEAGAGAAAHHGRMMPLADVLDGQLSELRPLLTPAERDVLEAILCSRTMAQAARSSGMSKRDFRARFLRIAAKGRGLILSKR